MSTESVFKSVSFRNFCRNIVKISCIDDGSADADDGLVSEELTMVSVSQPGVEKDNETEDDSNGAIDGIKNKGDF